MSELERSEMHKLTDRQIADMAFAVLREHNDNRLWRALTYDSGPYDVTTPTLALCHLARVFFAAGAAAEAKRRDPNYPCRSDGRCQYAIDHGAEGMGHCPAGKCVMPEESR